VTAPPGRALITGITGQDGSFLAELLLERGYDVTGMVRGGPGAALGLIEHLRDRITVIDGDLLDAESLSGAIAGLSVNEIYHLAAPTFVPDSWREPRTTISAIAGATATVLQAVIASDASTRVFVAG
jgi:GDPmannose 4,6-dehydratase